MNFMDLIGLIPAESFIRVVYPRRCLFFVLQIERFVSFCLMFWSNLQVKISHIIRH